MANNQYSQADVDRYNALNERSFRQIMSGGQGIADHGQCQETMRLMREEGQRLAQQCDQLSTRNRYLEDELYSRQPLREEDQRLAQQYDELTARNRYLEGELDARQRELDQKQRELDEKESESRNLNEHLEDQLEARQRELSRKQMELIQKQRELDQQEMETRQLREQSAGLRDVILADVGNQNVSDDQIIQEFMGMRQSALAVAKSQALSYDQAPALEPYTPAFVRNFYVNSSWNTWQPKDRELRVREKIYELLYYVVLDTSTFGIRASQAAPEETIDRITKGLGAFEATAKTKEVSTKVLGKWRAATFDCVEAFNEQYQASENVADQLWIFLSPIVNKRSPGRVTLRARVSALCEGALKFNAIMRKSPDEYRCEVFPTFTQNDPAGIGSWADAFAVDEGPDDDAGSTVAYVLFGALTKRSAYHEGLERVLVKAEVVVKRMSDPRCATQ